MGYTRVSISVSGSLERHNSAGDIFNDAARAFFLDELQQLTILPQFKRLRLEMHL